MISLKYYSHLILHSKYSFIIKLLIFFCIYLFFYFPTISFCMTEGNDVPQIAESKSVLNTEIEHLKEQITKQENMISQLEQKLAVYTTIMNNQPFGTTNILTSISESAEFEKNSIAVDVERHIREVRGDYVEPEEKHCKFTSCEYCETQYSDYLVQKAQHDEKHAWDTITLRERLIAEAKENATQDEKE